jgi:hypothetical protein
LAVHTIPGGRDAALNVRQGCLTLQRHRDFSFVCGPFPVR